MQLTPQDRLILWNLFEIRRLLDPNDETLETLAEIVAEGYEILYDDELAPHISEPMPEDQGRFVYDVLDIYARLGNYMREHPDDAEVRAHSWARFLGFDGNNETHLLGFCRFLIHKQGRWKEQVSRAKDTDDFNSHMPTANRYRRMIATWMARGKPSVLSAEDARAILDPA